MQAFIIAFDSGFNYISSTYTSVNSTGNFTLTLDTTTFSSIGNLQWGFLTTGYAVASGYTGLQGLVEVTDYIPEPIPPSPPSPAVVESYYYSYPPYLQPTPSLGTSARYAGSASINPRPRFANANRIYSFYKSINQVEKFYNDFVFSVYGKKK
jgi:hypothetical protein